jgi:hypothetical protein
MFFCNKNLFQILNYFLIINLYANACDIWKTSDCQGQPTTGEGKVVIKTIWQN